MDYGAETVRDRDQDCRELRIVYLLVSPHSYPDRQLLTEPQCSAVTTQESPVHAGKQPLAVV